MKWKLDDSRPIWPQLRDYLMRDIIAGKYSMGENFPTVRELAEEAGVNRNTMQRALSELENEGLVVTNRTAGRTVTTDAELIEMKRGILALQVAGNFIEEMQALGIDKDEAMEILKMKGEVK